MPETGRPPGVATDGSSEPGWYARARMARFSTTILRRLNLAGLLVLSAGLCTADFLLAGNYLAALLLTGVQALIGLPWGWTVFHLDRGERRLERRERERDRRALVSAHLVSVALLAAALAAKALVLRDAAVSGFGDLEAAYQTYVVAVFVVFVLGLVGRGARLGRFLATVADRPARLMALSFGLVALLGGFLLTLPVSLRHTADASFVDGLFTAMSAVCVTGLAVNDIGATYSGFGQGVILALIQAGGLGIMVLSAFFAVVAGRRLRVRSTTVLAEMIDAESINELRRTIRTIVVYTLILEAAGAVALYASWHGHETIVLDPSSPDPAAGSGSLAWAAVFHSVSAFCNAGFSLCHGNLTAFVDWPSVCFTICVLITLGGLGFPVLDEFVAKTRQRLRGKRPERWSLHFRVTLLLSAMLTFSGAAALLALEWGESFRDLSAGESVLAALFQSVTSRTAGFNTVNIGAMAPAALLFVSFLMFVGGSSGSCAGGIKTSTFAVLLATFRAELRGEPDARILDRRLPQNTVRRAVGVAVTSIVFVTLALFLLLITEAHEPLDVLFETVSAFATCGLSTGITPELSVVGKLAITLTMFVGRIGPLTFALAVAASQLRPRYTVPEGRLLIG